MKITVVTKKMSDKQLKQLESLGFKVTVVIK